MCHSTSALKLLITLIACPSVTSAQNAEVDQEFHTLHNLVISADGDWIAAENSSDKGMGNVRVCSTKNDKAFTIERGHSPIISRDSCWVSAFLNPKLEQLQGGVSKNRNAGQTLVLLNTQDGSRRTFDSVLSYQLTHFSSHLVFLQSPSAENDKAEPSKDKAAKPVAKVLNLGTLHVVELVSQRVFTWQNVTQYAAHQATSHGIGETWKKGYAYVAFVTHNEKAGRDRLEIALVGHSKRGWGTGGTYQGQQIDDLRWASDSITLGFFDHSRPIEKNGQMHKKSMLFTWHDVREQPGYREFTRANVAKQK